MALTVSKGPATNLEITERKDEGYPSLMCRISYAHVIAAS